MLNSRDTNQILLSDRDQQVLIVNCALAKKSTIDDFLVLKANLDSVNVAGSLARSSHWPSILNYLEWCKTPISPLTSTLSLYQGPIFLSHQSTSPNTPFIRPRSKHSTFHSICLNSSRLDYANFVLHGCSAKYILCLQSAQDAFTRVVVQSRPASSFKSFIGSQ